MSALPGKPCPGHTALVLSLVLVFAAPAQAGFHVHAGLGYGSYSASGDYMGSKSTDSLSAADLPLLIGLGYRFGPYMAMDVTHLEMDGLPTPASLLRHGVEGRGQRLAFQAGLPVTSHMAVYLRGGPFRWQASVKPSLNHGSEDFSGTDSFAGAGLRFPFTSDRIAGIVGYDRYLVGDIELSVVHLGLEIHFPR